MKKLSRREAALVRAARRKAIEEYEEWTWLEIQYSARLCTKMTLASLRELSELNGFPANRLVVLLSSPWEISAKTLEPRPESPEPGNC